MSLKPFDEAMLSKKSNLYVIITPDQARKLLDERNTHNRGKKEIKVAQYRKDMAAGKWHPEASDIKFDSNGVLLDGQNRLLACTMADVPFGTLIRTGLDPAAQDHMDTGAVRTMGDVFRMHGVTDYNNVAAAISLRARYESILNDGGTIMERRLPLTRQESLERLADHPQVEKFTSVATNVHGIAPAIARSVWLCGFSWAAEVDEQLSRRLAAAMLAGDVSAFPQTVAMMRYTMAVTGPTMQQRAVKLKNAGLRHWPAFA